MTTKRGLFALSSLLLLVPLSLAHPQRRQPDPARTRIVFLGTGTPIADPNHFGPSLAIVVHGTPYIVDAGTGVVRRAVAASRKGIPALRVRKLKIVFLTHLHSDHTLGLPDLLLTPAVLGRGAPLEVYGPLGTRDMIHSIFQAWKKDIDIRLHGLEHGNPKAYKADVHEIHPGVVYKDANVKVTAFLVKHGSWDQAFGFRFDTADRSIVISGDTRPTQAVVKACHGCDVLIHEVYCQAGFDRLPRAERDYHSHFHTSTRELARIATEARPGDLILDHELLLGCSERQLVEEVKQGFKGRVYSAHDLDVF
jgi:ribonuclease BN (tRNA processing enzyme)